MFESQRENAEQARIAPACAYTSARLAQSVERKALNLVVVGSSPTVGEFEISAGQRRSGKEGEGWRGRLDNSDRVLPCRDIGIGLSSDKGAARPRCQPPRVA